jgi:hypothetical protein
LAIGDKAGLHDNAVSGESALDQFMPCKLALRDIHIHHILPSSRGAMQVEHRDHSRGRRAAPSITTMSQRWDHGAPMDAFLAHSSIPEQCGSWAKQTEVVHGLNDRHTLTAKSIVCGWRDQRERIVNVGDIWRSLADRRAKTSIGRVIPDAGEPGHDSTLNPGVVILVAKDRMPFAFEKRGFGRKDAILTPSLLVVVVNAKDGFRVAHLEIIARQAPLLDGCVRVD